MVKQAAIAWAAAEPLSVENVEVAPPKAHEVRIKILHTGVCHTGEFRLLGSPQFMSNSLAYRCLHAFRQGSRGRFPGDSGPRGCRYC